MFQFLQSVFRTRVTGSYTLGYSLTIIAFVVLSGISGSVLNPITTEAASTCSVVYSVAGLPKRVEGGCTTMQDWLNSISPVCQTSPAQCSPTDNTTIKDLTNICVYQTGTLCPTDATDAQIQQVQAMYQAQPSEGILDSARKSIASNCFPNFEFNRCIWRPVMSSIGSLFLSLGGGFLRLAGTLFDSLIQRVIIDFKTTLDTLHITGAIDAGWTVFRDFSNILIIGMFVFIAISIILGLKEYGQKKLIATVLVIAVLINFSLLFTKIIIDTSNLVAYQIYGQIAEGGQLTDGKKFDIAESFLKPMGITSIWDTSEITTSIGQSTNSGFAGFFFGLIGGIMLLAVALVLLYGCFLIATRAILFIFLMLTASLAFASHLIPSLSNGQYGWSTWWKALINNAVFAPLLMIFLAVSLRIMQQAGSVGEANMTLGQVLADPSKQLAGGGWTTILIYIIGIGVLYASFKVSSTFASSISGFNMAAMIPALGLGAASRVTGFVGRKSVGRLAQATSNKLGAMAQNENSSMIARRLAAFGSNQAKTLSTKDFNAMKTGLGAAISKTSGLSQTTLGGKDVKGYAGAQKALAEKFAKQAEALTPKKINQEDTLHAAIAAEIKNSPSLAQQHQAATETHKGREDAHSNEQATLVTIQKKHDAEMAGLEKELREAAVAGDSARESAAKRDILITRTRHASEMGEQTDKITMAKKAVTNAHAAIKSVENSAKTVGIAKGTIPADEKFKTETTGEILSSLVNNRYTLAPFKEEENKRIIELAEKHMDKTHKERELEESGIAKMIKKIASDEKKAAEGGTTTHTTDH